MIRSHHGRRLQELAIEHRDKLIDAIVGGIANDYAAYRQLVGQVQGINDAMKLSEEADMNISGEA